MERTNKSLFEQLSPFYYRKWLLIIPVIIGALIGLAVSSKLPRHYSSTTTVLVEDLQIPEQYVPNAEKTPFIQRLNVMSQKILSRAKLEAIIKEFNLYSPKHQDFFTRFAALFYGESGSSLPMDALVEKMREDITFEMVGEIPKRNIEPGSNMFAITYTGTNPATVKMVTDRLAALFIEENTKAREEFTEGASRFLSTQLGKSKGELERLERSIKDFKEKHMGSLPEQLEANLRTLDRLQSELQTLSGQIKNAADRKAVLEEQMKVVGPVGKTMNPVAAEIMRLKNELSVMQSMYKDTYPDIIIAKKRIKELESELEKGADKDSKDGEYRNPEVYAELAGARSQLTTLKQREAEVRKLIKDYEKRVEVTPRNEQLEADLMRDYAISRENYQALLEKSFTANAAEELEKKKSNGRYKVIDPAYMPLGPISPNELAVTGMGAAGGFATGAGLVLLFEMLNPAFRKPEDFEGVIPSPVLTSIPVFPLRKIEQKLTVIKGRKSNA